MKRFLYPGLFLIFLTLISCSRKKTEENQLAVNTESAGENSSVSEASSISGEEILPEEDIHPEEEIHATQLLDYLENEENFTSPIIENPDAEDFLLDVETVEKRLVDSYNRLKVMEYGSEIFIPAQNQEEKILVHYADKKAIRYFYDNLYRLTRKEYWTINSATDYSITIEEEYFYNEDSKKPYEKKILSDENIIVSNYNENGLVIRTEKYKKEDSQKGKSSESLFPLMVRKWTYDDKERITSESVEEGSKVKKEVFIYSKLDKLQENEESFPPDYEYYENGELKIKTEYVKKGQYTTTINFDSRNSVKTDYLDFIKTRDLYYTDGDLVRIRNYE